MKNYLLVNRALAAEKNFLLFNQSFGTEGSPNQTGETLTRENRIGLMSYLRRTLMLLLVAYIGIGNVWADTQVTISPCSKDDKDTYASSYHFVADGTAITSIVGAGAAEESYNSGTPKVTVNGKTNVDATITFTIASGVTITSFKVTGTAQAQTTYDLDGSSVTFGTALTSLSKTSSMVFKLHCTDAASSSTKRNTTISSFVIEYTTSGGATTHTVTAESNNDSYGTVSAGSSSVAEGSTTTITATPATGYQVTNWAVSGTGASISPSGTSNSNTTALTMGTANATVTATFGPKSYTVTLNNQSATTDGTESVTTTYNSNTNLTSAITKPTKDGKVFAGYFTAANGGGVQLIDPAGNWIASAGGNNTYMDGSKNWKNDGSLTLYACWMEYASTFDIQAWVQSNIDDTKTSTTYTILGTNKLIYSLGGSSALDNSNKSSYEGLKMKNSGDYVMFLVQANSALKLYFGYTGTDPKKSINGGAEADMDVSSTGTETANQEVDLGTQTYDRLVKVRTVNGNSVVLQKIEITAACTAADHVDISGEWAAFIGYPISLTATAYDDEDNAIETGLSYQWYKDGTADGNMIDGATSATYYKASAELSDYGSYYCKVSKDGCTDVWTDAFGVKIMRIHLMWENGTEVSDYAFHNFAPIGGSKAVCTIALEGYNYSLQVLDGQYGWGDHNNAWFGRSNYWGTTENPWAHDVVDNKTYLNCDIAGDYVFTLDYSDGYKLGVMYPQPTYYYKGNDDAWSSTHEMTKSCDGTYAYFWTKGATSLQAAGRGTNNNNFLIMNAAGNSTIADGNKLEIRNGEATGFGGTDIWGSSNMGKWDGSSSNASIYNAGDFYIVVFYPNNSINTTNDPKICASTKLPGNATTADEVVYFEKPASNWGDKAYYRIGHRGTSSAPEMELVSGTARLYQHVLSEWTGYEAWSIANNSSWQGSNNSIYQVNTGDTYAVTKSTNYFKCETDGNITIILDDANNTADGCTYYNVNTYSGMLTHTATVSDMTNGSVQLNWTDVNDAAQSATSTTSNLAHTCNLQITGVPATGYDVATLTVNGSNFTSGDTHVLSADATIAATFSLHNYNVTYSAPGNGNNYTIKVADGSATSTSKTATMGQTITIVASPATGYDFTGWTITKAGGAGTVTPADASATTTTFTMPTSDVTITASFTLKTYTITAAVNNGDYGSVSPASITVDHGSTISISDNVLTCDGNTLTATATTSTAQYTYAFDNWTGVTHGATVTSNLTATANFTRTANSYTLTWNLAGGKVTVAGTGADVNATGTPNSEVAFGTAITAPTVTKTGYNFSAWSSTPASTMPAANTTYTATWTAKQTTITINANTGNHGSTAPSSITATYGSELPSFTAATGTSGYSLTGYFTEATSGTKVINADGTLVAGTDYADGSGNWKYEPATLTLYPQYEEEMDEDEHVYYYKDATHYVSSSYKNPEGGAPSGTDNVELTTPWTIRNNTFMTGLTSVVATAARYDNKENHMNAYIKLRQTDGGKIVFTIASGYTATIKIKMGGYSGKNESITMKLNDSGDNIAYSGTMSGAGTTEDNYAQLTYADLAAGAYTLKPTSGSLYISQIDIETEAVAACTAAPTVTAGSNSSVTSTTATVSCASGISALGTGGCTITSYGFVIGTVTGPTIGGSGVTRHEVGTSYASTGTPFSKDLTGLTAETTYYVRPYATNGFGTAYGTQTSFTTTAAGEDPIPALISYYLQTPNSKTQPTSLSTDSIITTPKRLKGDTLKNFVPVTLGSSLDITKAGKGDGGTWSAGIGTTPADSATAVTDAYAAKLAFDIHDDYELNISSITLNVKSVTNANQIYRVKVSDGEHTVYGRVAPGKDSDNSVVFGSFSGIKFSGTVTLTLWVWSTAAAEYRLKSPIQIDGTLTRKATACTMPTQTFITGAYTLGDDALDLSSLFGSNSSGAVTYSVVSAGGTSAAIVGSSFTASNTGTATIRASQAADGAGNYCAKSIETTITVSGTCTPQSLVKTVLSSTKAGTTTGYNDGEYAGEPVIATFEGTPTEGGYKLKSGSKLFVTLKKGNFVAGDKINIVITQASDLTNTIGKLLIFYNASTPTLLKTIDAASAGTYTYTLTDDDITTLGSNKTIGVFRSSSTTENNPYVKSVEVAGCRDWTVCPAPDAVVAGSETHNSAVLTVTDAEETGNYEFYYSTSSTAPTASTVALATGSALTKTITGLSASETYYYWVRSNCGGVTKSAWVAGTPATFTTTAAPSTYSVTYNGNGKTDGDVPTDATAYAAGDIVTVKGNTGSLTKTGETFLGWSTSSTASSGTFYPAGYKFVMPAEAVTLYAVWGSVGATTINIAYFETSLHNYNSTTKKPDAAGKYLYGYTNSAKTGAYAYTLTTSSTNNVGQGTGASDYLRMDYGTTVTIYADSATKTTPAGFTGVTAVSVDFKMKNSSYSTTFDIYVGSTKIADNVSLAGDAQTAFKTYTYSGLSNLDGVVKIVNKGSGSSNYHFYVDNISISYGSGASSGYTVSFNMKDHGSAIADIENIPSGSKIGAPLPEPTATDWDFGGWYKETGCTNEWNFATDAVSANTTLYAKWSNCAPTITTHPVSANYNQNGVASALTVVAATNGGGDLHYQWWVKENDLADEDGSAIPGETGTSFTPSTELLGTSYYYCVVSNDCGNVKTNTAAVTIRDAKPDPTAVWAVTEPTHGGQGFSFSVTAKDNDGTGLWDGTLTAEMLSVSSEAVLGTVTVNDETKTISGTYGVKASATNPVTFYLLLPATETLAAKRLDYDRSFEECVGGDGSTHDIRVLKANKNITFGGGTVYGWDNPGEGFLTASTGGTVSTDKAGTKMDVFDTVYNTNKKAFWVMPYAAGIKKIKVYGDVRVKELEVSNVRKVKAFNSGKDANNIAFSAAYEGGGDNVATTGYHWFEIILEDALDANDIIYFTVSENFQISGVRVTEAGSGGSLNTSLVWSNSDAIAGTVNKNEGDADFSITATRGGTYADDSNASLGAISYNSSKPEVATVDAATGKIHIVAAGTTVIKATLAASGCYKKAEITYSLVVAEYVCAEAAGTVIIKSEPDCAHKELTVTDFEEGATTFQWYKDGEVIGGATSQDYTATASGTYSVSTQKTCAVMSANSITLTFDAATATKIVDSWYIKNGRRTPDIALVQTKNATGFTVTSSSDPVTSIGGCTFELKEDGIIYLHGTTSTGAAPSGMTPGDMTITITATACSNAAPLDIVLHIQSETAKPSIAFVVDGTLRKDGGTATSVLEAKTSDRPLWKYLENTFALTGCNAYWSVDSKELRQYYSQFDAILITDDPSTDTKGTGGVSYVKAFGTMVDVRPVLTMEAYVGKFKDGGWHVYDATPSSPNPRQVELKLECKNHDIFKGLNPATSDNVRTTTDEYGNEYWHVIMVDTTQSPYHNTKDSYEALPALQGFDRTKFSNMLGVGTIFEEKLQGGVERQEEPAARMMILGIQNNAMGALTNEGKLIVKNALEYLLKTNMEDVNDCANYFTNADGDGQWSTAANWTRGEVPDFETRARILQPVTIGDGTTAIAARVDIAASGESKHLGQSCKGSITIEPQGILKVGGKVTRAKAPYFGIDDLQPTENSDLVVKASTTAPHNQGALIFNNTDGDTHAVVEMWNPSHWEMDGGKKKKYWSYVAVPIQEADIPNFFWYGFTYLYDETSGWIKKGDGTSLYPFQGIGASLQEGNMETFYGPLATTESQDITLTYTAGKGQGMNLIGNSWTAPIQIANFEEDDFGDATAEVWVFNTGNTNDGHTTMADGDAGTTTAGQWQTIPIGVAGLPGYTGLKVIPAMQAFEVNTESETTLHLDYDRLVRAGRENLNEPMRAPRRSAAKQIETTMRVRVSGELTHTDVYLLKDARFSDAFDNGWDGHYLSGDDRSAQLYAISEEEGKLAFLAQPEIEGTVLGFAPSKDGNEYTFSFSYDGDEEYYLNDLKLTSSTLISGENSYMFTYEEGDTNRFYISRQPLGAPAVATGVDNPREEAKPRKFIYKDKMYILYNGRVFDATGKIVK